MKVKVGDKVYGSGKQPIMVILTERDKENIANMIPSATRYAAYDPEVMTSEEALEWMEEI